MTSFITKHMPAELIEGLQKLRRKESQANPIATPSTGPSPAHSGALPASPSVTKMGASVPQAAQAAAAAEEHTVSKQELRWANCMFNFAVSDVQQCSQVNHVRVNASQKV